MPNSPRSVEIIGGGLAGLALGLGLRAHRIPVTIHEAGAYPRHRVCGEFIAGLDRETLRIPGLSEALARALPARTVAWHESGRIAARHTLPETALCLSRHRLDTELADAFVRSGGKLRLGSRLPPDPRPGRVLACGRRANTASPWIGRKQHFQGLELSDDLELHLGRRAYAGLTRIEGNMVNVCGLFPRAGAPQDMIGHIRACGLPALADRLSMARPIPGSGCAVAGLDYHVRGMSSRGAIMLGDRNGLIPPFTGNGMTIALQSAATAIPHIVAWTRGTADWNETSIRIGRELGRRFNRRIRWARRLHPWLLQPGRRRIVRGLLSCGLLPLDALYRVLH